MGGHGTKIITREGRIFIYIHKKARSQALRKTKAQMIKWTTAWRRANKKIKTSDINKKKRRKAKRVVREITGMTADEINRRKAESTADRDAKKMKPLDKLKKEKLKLLRQIKLPQQNNSPNQLKRVEIKRDK